MKTTDGTVALAKESLSTEGFYIWQAFLSDSEAALLSSACHDVIARVDEEMERDKVEVRGGTRKGLQYFDSGIATSDAALMEFLSSGKMGMVLDGLVGAGHELYWDQLAVKCAASGQRLTKSDGGPQCLGEFSWHQDSGYAPPGTPEYLSCWFALSDVPEESGCVRVIPRSRMATWEVLPHREAGANGDKIACTGTEEGVALPMDRCDLLVFSSYLLHASRPNFSPHDRLAYLSQFVRSTAQVQV